MNDELTDADKEEIANKIKEGFTSGRLDSKERFIAWELKTLIWKE